MLHPEQPKDIGQPSPISIAFEELSIDGVDHGPAEILVTYDERGRLLLSLGDYMPNVAGLESKVQVKYKVDSEPLSIFITKLSFDSERGKPIVEARLAREPMIIVDRPSPKRFEAVLLSAPQFVLKPIVLCDRNGAKFELKPFKSEEGASCFIRSDLHLDANAPLEPLQTFLNFLTFAKGSHCGLGNLFAYDEKDLVSFRLLGFSRSDTEKRVTNWFDVGIQRDLPEIFRLFSEASTDELTNRALRQTINFYRASNASRRVSVEMAIIAAHSALEAIVNFILAFRAGWSKSMMSNRSIAFSDKNRAAAQHFGINCDPLSQSPQLVKFSKKSNGIDVFEIISRFRNRLVHQDIKNSPTGIQLHETWLISQWLVEILVFGVIGYRGDIIDRRIYNGWRGTTCQVPLSRSI